jgi:hypothetical protein
VLLKVEPKELSIELHKELARKLVEIACSIIKGNQNYIEMRLSIGANPFLDPQGDDFVAT